MPTHQPEPVRALSDAQIRQFIDDGFVRLEGAFPRELADQGRAILWRDLPCDPDNSATWTQPVIRLGYYGNEPFKRAVNTPVLHAAFDQLVGKGRWYPRGDLGTFPVRFPSSEDPGDAGWHIDVSFPAPSSDPGGRQDYSSWRANITSRGRALLMLFLFSDVGECDAPTRIRVGSHRDIARLLEPAGEAGSPNWTPGELGASPGSAGGVGNRRSRHGLSLPSLPVACRADASGRGAALHGAAAAASGRAFPARSGGR